MGIGSFFQGGINSGFFQRYPRVFRETKHGEISFFPLETKKTIFFAQNLIGKYQISKSWGGTRLPCPPSDAHDC